LLGELTLCRSPEVEIPDMTESSAEPTSEEQPLRCPHTNTFPAILEQLGISLLVTTYQAGKLVALRADDGEGGVWAIHTQTGVILGWVKFEDAVQEIFAVRVVPGIRFPDLVNHDMKLLDGSFVLPDADLQRVPQAYRDLR
jgi:hypothetical protein